MAKLTVTATDEGFDIPQSSQEPPQEPLTVTPEDRRYRYPEGSYGADMQSKIDARVGSMGRGFDLAAEDKQTYLEAAVQAWGQTIQLGMDMASTTVGHAIDNSKVPELLSAMTPDEAEAFLKEQIAAGGTALMNTNTAKALYELYQGMDETTRRDVDAAVNIGFGGFKNLLPKKAQDAQLGTKMVESGVRAEKNSIGKYVLLQTPKAKQARAAEIGKNKAQQTVLNYEDQLLNTVLSVRGISSSTPRPKMTGLLNKEIASLGTDIKASLAGVDVKIPKQVVTLRVRQALAQLKKSRPEFADKDLSPIVEKVMRSYISSNKGYTGKPAELLDLRKHFDQVMKKKFSKDVLAGEDVSREVASVIRNTLNDLMDNVIPDATIKAKLHRQSRLIDAVENLSDNIAHQKSPLSKVVAKVEHHPMLTTSILTGAGIGGKLIESEGLMGGVGVLGAAYLGSRPIVRKAIGGGLEQTPLGRSLLMDGINSMPAPQEQEQEQEQQ